VLAGVEERRVATQGVTLNVAVAGPSAGHLVILLHGFPEHWYAWHKQISALAERGYWVWAPDQRGYHTSDKPQGLAAYRIDVLARDVAGLVAAAGRESASVVGHDWGGAVAWRVAQDFPERVARLVTVNGPHPAAMRRALRSSPRQLMRSWYMFFFQLPGAERILLANGAARLVRGLRRTSLPGTFDDALVAVYRRAWEQPGAMRAMLDWYKATFRERAPRARQRRVTAPTLVVHGARDAFIGLEVARSSVNRCDDGRLVIIDEATHWIHLEDPERVNAELLSFLEPVRAGG
jgi:pimeloyl-ACP methyl ester carboxylesterase